MENNYLQIVAQAIIKHKDTWKDNPNKYTSLIFKIAPALPPHKRKELNMLMAEFAKRNYGLRIETAEKMIYFGLFYPLMGVTNQIIKVRQKSQAGEFDCITNIKADVIGLERQLRNIAFFCMYEFKALWNKSRLEFNNDNFAISDIQTGAITHL